LAHDTACTTTKRPAREHIGPAFAAVVEILEKTPEIVLAIATTVLAIATIILAVIAGIQAYILATTDASTRKVAKAAQSAAGTAKATLEASTQSFRQEQRPYLWASSFNMANPPVCQIPGGTRICADVHIVNSGRRPAVGVHIHRYASSIK
jgi:hypothetical protein